MSINAAIRRIGVTIPFFVVAVLVLGFFSRPVSISTTPPGSAPAPFIIVTTGTLQPAFAALQAWNHQMGCPAGMIVLPKAGSRERAKSMVTYLGALCRLRGTTGLLLGGDDRLVPVLPYREFFVETAGSGIRGMAMPPRLVPVPTSPRGFLPDGLRVGRAPVRDLTEAWAFVEACRATGLTLDRLMVGDISPSMAAAVLNAVRETSPAVGPTTGNLTVLAGSIR